MATKRKVLSLAEKVDIITEVDNNPNEKRIDMAKRLGLPPSTLNTIMSKRNSIKEAAIKCGVSSKKRKKSKESPLADLENCLLKWFNQMRASNMPISGSILKEKAKVIANRLGIQNFQASNGWIGNFKARHGISYNTAAGDSAGVDQDIVNHWKTVMLPQHLKGYAPQDIYNADETGLFFALLPDKTMVAQGEKCHGGEKSKERISVVLCCNADGSDKLEPLVIGKPKKPHAFKNIRNLPCEYAHQQKAWIDSELFAQFLRSFDAKMESHARKVILFIDHCAAHPTDIHLQNVKIVFLPASCTSELQPLNCGIIQNFKHFYRTKIVQKLVAMFDIGVCDFSDVKIDILRAMNFVTASWAAIKPSTIAYCFAKAGFNFQPCVLDVLHVCHDTDVVTVKDEILQDDWNRVTSGAYEFDDFVTCDDSLETCCVLSIDEICEEAVAVTHNSDEVCADSGSDDDYPESTGPPPTVSEALIALETLWEFAFSAPEGSKMFGHLQCAENVLLQILAQR